MNYTVNYHLPQWEESDRVMRTDFNQMCVDIEAGIAQAQESAEALPFVAGSYSGGGGRTVTLGFRPSVVIVGESASSPIKDGDYGVSIQPGIFCGDGVAKKLVIKDTGFEIPFDFKETYPSLNTYGHTYCYVAFR